MFIQKKYLLLICFSTLIINNIYGFYNILGDVPFQYIAVFDGKIILESKFLYYTNDNMKFNFDYTVMTREETVSNDQVLVDWHFSQINNPDEIPLFNLLWDSLFKKILKDISYTVMLPNDQFLVIDKNGKRHPLGYFLELLLPITSLKNNSYESSTLLDFLDENRQQRYLKIDVEGWDFFKYKRTNKAPLPALDTNSQLINALYKSYAQQNKNTLSMIYWAQNFNTSVTTINKESISSGEMTGIYKLNQKMRTMDDAIIISKFNTVVNFTQNMLSIPINIKIEGIFKLKLKKDNGD